MLVPALPAGECGLTTTGTAGHDGRPAADMSQPWRARIVITSVLHTWGSALTHHPHVLTAAHTAGWGPVTIIRACDWPRGSSLPISRTRRRRVCRPRRASLPAQWHPALRSAP